MLALPSGGARSCDASCQADMQACSDPASCWLFCRGNGRCGGWNAGFLRDDAQLTIAVVSDAPDHDPRPVAEVVDSLKNIKGYYNVSMLRVDAVIEPPGGCTAGAGTPIPADDRYRQVVEQTNGVLASMCEADWRVLPMIIGSADFHLKMQFFLSRLADPATLKVAVDGQDCTAHWKYDFPSNSVLPDTTSSCVPQPGQQISITYNELCLGTG